MGNENEVLKEMLIQQQAWTTKMLTEQKQWMEAVLGASQAGPPNVQSVSVPTFHAFNKEIQTWDSYVEQLEQHFAAYSVQSAEKKKSFF